MSTVTTVDIDDRYNCNAFDQSEVKAEWAEFTARPRPERCPWCGMFNHHHPLCVSQCDEWAVTMPFGKHKGERVENVPRDYLWWLIRRGGELEPELRGEIDRVLEGDKP